MLQSFEQLLKQEVVLLQNHHQPSTKKKKKDEVNHMVSLIHSCLPVSMREPIVVKRLQWSGKKMAVLSLKTS